MPDISTIQMDKQHNRPEEAYVNVILGVNFAFNSLILLNRSAEARELGEELNEARNRISKFSYSF